MDSYRKDSSDYVRTMIQTVLTDINSRNYTGSQLREKYHEFYEKFPSLFELLLSDKNNFDFDKLNRYLDLSDKVIAGQLPFIEKSTEIFNENWQEYASHIKTQPK